MLSGAFFLVAAKIHETMRESEKKATLEVVGVATARDLEGQLVGVFYVFGHTLERPSSILFLGEQHCLMDSWGSR